MTKERQEGEEHTCHSNTTANWDREIHNNIVRMHHKLLTSVIDHTAQESGVHTEERLTLKGHTNTKRNLPGLNPACER